MRKFISTETTMLLSFLSRTMPNLFKYIGQHSAPPSKKIADTAAIITALSPQQVQEARAHPSGIFLHTLNTIASVQKALNTTTNKLDDLTKQRGVVENALVTLISVENKEKESKG